VITLLTGWLALALFACKEVEGPAAPSQDTAHTHGTPTDWKFTVPPGSAAEGRKLFVEAEWHNYHEIIGEKLPELVKEKGDVGPELSHMAGVRAPEYFLESIVNSNALNRS
jgi:hypothetical protein